MPTEHGSSDAIAVEAWIGHELNSAYTFLLGHIVILIWGGIVLIGVLASVRRYEHNHPNRSIYTKIWDQRSSPFGILRLTGNHFMKSNSSRWILLVWLVLALAFLVMKYAIPIVFARYIILDNAAPVASEAIYVPTYQNISDRSDPKKVLEIYALEVPSVLRAAGSVDSVNSTGSAEVSVDRPELLPDQGNGTGIRIKYRYKVTGLDFGLQKYPDLALNVEGACSTEYTWLNSSGSADGVNVDSYNLFGDPNAQFRVSLYDGISPAGYFFFNPSVRDPPSNFSWAAFVSSIDRLTFWPSTDPWYLTVPNPSANPTAPYTVGAGRPALSCWQNDVWSYRGNNSTVIGLNSSMLPGLDLPAGLQAVFAHFLGQPKIVNIGTRLGASALKSASTSFGGFFNASTSSVYNDLERLVFASYIATVNTLTDTTLFSTDGGIGNDVVNQTTLVPYAGVDEFVIWSSNVITLSVKSIIVIPVLAAVLWIVFIGVLLLPIPIISALTVTVSVSNVTTGPQKEPKEETQEPSRTEKVIEVAVQQVLSIGEGDV
ncbi:hypothetical protein MMC30_005606 [Trapelia coarctata]|nr:hypothetical protein [Trapelia coarctata]